MATSPTIVLSAAAAITVTVSGTTLFDVAAQYLGDARQWNRIARLNGIWDPWIDGITTLKIPLPELAASNDGILGL
jgi:hypothetical protein